MKIKILLCFYSSCLADVFKNPLHVPSPKNISASYNRLVPQKYTYENESRMSNSELRHCSSGWLSRDRFMALRTMPLPRRLKLNIDHSNFKLFLAEYRKLFSFLLLWRAADLLLVKSRHLALSQQYHIPASAFNGVPYGKPSPSDFI